MMFNKLQYISQGNTVKEQLFNIHQALDNGCDWIQLRYKTGNTLELFDLAESVKIMCDVYLAELIINDHVHLAHQLDADGVHLGLDDMSVKEAKIILGDTKIIGGTANTFDHVLHRAAENCDYIGLGPFQHTITKEKLSPTLGIEGYRCIIEQMKIKKINIPVYAIGGITLENIEYLLSAGIHGIAVSGVITHSKNQSELITQLNEKLYVSI